MDSVQNDLINMKERRFDLAKDHDTIQSEHAYSDWLKRECDAEIFGNLDAGQSVYAVLDATKVTNLPELLSTSQLEYRCLFTGEAAEQLGNVAPWIVKLSQDDLFTQRLLRVGETPWQLWQAEPMLLLKSFEPLEAVWKHLRRFARVRDVNDHWLYFRYYEPANFNDLDQADLNCLTPFLLKLMNDRFQSMIVPDNERKAILIFRKSKLALETTVAAIAATTTLAEDARVVSERYMAKKLRTKAIEVREFGLRYGAQDHPTRRYIALLLLLRDQFGFRYWDDLTRVACACAAAGAHDHSQVKAHLKTAPLSSKSEQALVLYRNQIAGEPYGHN